MLHLRICELCSRRIKDQLHDQFRAPQGGSESSWCQLMRLDSGTEEQDSRSSSVTWLITWFRWSKGEWTTAQKAPHNTSANSTPNSGVQGFLRAYLMCFLFIRVRLCFRWRASRTQDTGLYGWNSDVPLPLPKFLCWNPNPQYLRMWLYLDTGPSKDVLKVKWSHVGGP